MPCTKCKDDKYKWGKTGECEYASKEACESANSKYSKMRPTPLGKKSYEEYAKELKEFNLSSVKKIELAISDDLEQATKRAYEFRRECLDAISDASDDLRNVEAALGNLEDIQDNLRTSSDDLNDTLGELNAETRKAEAAAEALGISPSDLPSYNDAMTAIKDAAGVIDEANDTDMRIDEFIR